MRALASFPLIAAAIALPQTAHAQSVGVDSGDTAWMILCALIVLIAALPGLALRRAGLANARNGLSAAAQGLGMAATASLAWGIAGYSLAYAPGGGWLGGGANLFMGGMADLREGLTVPETAFALFQMTLALLGVTLIAGALAERARFGWMLLFAPLWLLIVYAPVARWMWGGGWLAELGALDFAGALVVHLTAGCSALVLGLIIGPRERAEGGAHAPLLTLAGSAMLWVGLMAANGGWALGAANDAASALLNTHFAACAGLIGWALTDRLLGGRTSATGLASGAIAGLVAISASAGLVGGAGAMAIGLIAAIACRIVAGMIGRGRIDDPARIFAVHGVGGLIGALLLIPFTPATLGGVGFDPSVGYGAIIAAQLIGIAAIAVWAMLGSAILGLGLSFILPMRVSADEEATGLDAAHHGQQAWDFR
ncbi:Amt family ammonium transporter [Sphingobium fontiphilum]|uniref:Amt family ammonium transporter n=1 Tax=Sphingobium fontiphilum TaxID=944425 RepID=A0A7W6DKY7_9SPHN|nr:ammonium transporter [Sphingobium fontiphilum]MBB3983306.1 Amt family ammonium transporter [Sphingobium fontiphilum]